MWYRNIFTTGVKKIKNKGIFNGETGSCPYVKEIISEGFSLLRFETYCYPLFVPNKDRGVNKYLLNRDTKDIIKITML